MMVASSRLLGAVLPIVVVVAALAEGSSGGGGNRPWPLPASMTLSNLTVVVAPTFTLECCELSRGWCAPNSMLARAVARARPRLSPGTAAPPQDGDAVLRSLVVCIRAAAPGPAAVTLPGPEVDESYTLAVPGDGGEVTIEAATVFGALHALQSLQHLVSFSAPGRIVNAPVQVRQRCRLSPVRLPPSPNRSVPSRPGGCLAH